MRPVRNCFVILAMALSVICVFAQAGISREATNTTVAAEHPLTIEQVREFLKLSGSGEIYRAGWMASLETSRSKAAPYWPESFWDDLRAEMRKADLAPMVLDLYRPFISDEMMRSANEFLRTKSLTELATTPFGAKFCKLQQAADVNSQAETLKLTETIFVRVYERHKPQIEAAREKYLADHPDYKD